MNETSNIVLTADNITLDGRFEVTKQIFIDENKVFSEDSRLKAKDIFICMSSGSKKHVGKVAYIPSDTKYFAGGFMGIIRITSEDCISKYLYYILNTSVVKSILSGESSGSNINNLSNQIGTVKIPIPPLDIQQQIIDECTRVDKEYETTRMSIETYRQEIEGLFAELDSANRTERLSLSDAEKFETTIGKRVLNKQLIEDGKIPVYSANVTEPFGYMDELLITDFSVPSILWGIDGDWMINYIPKDTEFYPTDHCGVLRCKTDEVNPRYMVHILDMEGNKMGFSRAYRASIDRIQGITFSVPDRAIQDETINKIIQIEDQITEAEKKLETLKVKNAEIVSSYL